MAKKSIIAVALVATVVSPLSAFAQGSAGTGSTSTGIGAPAGPAGPGIRSNGWTQQPGAATNTARKHPSQPFPKEFDTANKCDSKECAGVSEIIALDDRALRVNRVIRRRVLLCHQSSASSRI
jgi:hypothetical protein